ncbi:MAG: hypothetical protein ACXAB4_13960, partial [Candidatus Hodarchaeales archaeon]
MALETIRGALSEFYSKQIDPGADIDVVDLQKLTSGWETEVYSFDVSYFLKHATKGDKLILRTFPGTGGNEKAMYEFEVMKG